MEYEISNRKYAKRPTKDISYGWKIVNLRYFNPVGAHSSVAIR